MTTVQGVWNSNTTRRTFKRQTDVTSTSHFMLIFKRAGWDNTKSEESMTTSEPFDFAKYTTPQLDGEPIHRLPSHRTAESNDGEKSAGNLSDLLGQVSKNSTGEIDSLIGELRRLRGKLQTDGDRIQRDIEEYATLSQQVMQLTKIIYDSVAKLPNAHTSVDSGRTH